MRKFVPLLLAVSALSTIATAAAPLPDAVPIEVFATLPAMESPELSPDGTKIAGKVAVDGKQMLMVIPLTGGGKPAVFQPGKVDVNWWSWAGDNWLAVGLGKDEVVLGEQYYITRLLGVSADLQTLNQIDWKNSGQIADRVIWTARDGSPRVLLSKQTGFTSDEKDFYPSVFEADLSTGKTRMISGSYPGVMSWYADAAGNVRLGNSYDPATRRWSVEYRPDNRSSFKTIRLGEDKDSFPYPALFRADGSALAIDDRSGRDEIYELALPSFTLGQKLFSSEKYDIDTAMLTPGGDGIEGVRRLEKRTRIDWIDPALKRIQQDLDGSVGVGNARIVDRSRDRQKLLVRLGSPSQAGGTYFWDTRSAKMQLLMWDNAQLRNRTLSPVSTVEFAARDGTKIEAVLTLPRGRVAKNLPLIVMPHGGPFARDSEEFDFWTQFLAEKGYAVIQPNYRGSSGYGTAFAKLGEGEWGLKMQDDLNDAMDFVVKQGIADAGRVCIAGGSYGGYAAMRGAQRDGKRFRCAISYAGVSDLASMARYDSQFLLGDVRKRWLRKQAPDLNAVSPRFFARSFSAPILLVHGAEDRRVPVRQSRLMADELRKAGRPVEYIEQPLADHHFSRGEDRLQFLKAMDAFLDKHNPA